MSSSRACRRSCSQRQAQDLSIALATLEEKLTVTLEQVTVKDKRLKETEEKLERDKEELREQQTLVQETLKIDYE